MTTVLVTGATGTLGRSIAPALAADWEVRAATRDPSREFQHHLQWVRSPSLERQDEDWSRCLDDVDCVVHLAALAHVRAGSRAATHARIREVNALGTRRLAMQAAAAGVRRFVFMSSIKALGERSGTRPLRPEDPPEPQDAYGHAKLEAEVALRGIAADTGLEVVILRPPLVYGPYASGNFARLTQWIRRGVPLPFAAVENRRSLVGIDNLVSAVRRCIAAPQAAGRTFHVCDREALSTAELVRLIAAALDKPARMLAVRPGLLERGLAVCGARSIAQRLLGNLEVDGSLIERELAWEPPLGIREGIMRALQSQWDRM